MSTGQYLEAAQTGKLEIIDLYIKQNAGKKDALNVTDAHEQTALMIAIHGMKHSPIVTRLLQEQDFNVNATCREGNALHFALRYNPRYIPELMKRKTDKQGLILTRLYLSRVGYPIQKTRFHPA